MKHLVKVLEFLWQWLFASDFPPPFPISRGSKEQQGLIVLAKDGDTGEYPCFCSLLPPAAKPNSERLFMAFICSGDIPPQLTMLRQQLREHEPSA